MPNGIEWKEIWKIFLKYEVDKEKKVAANLKSLSQINYKIQKQIRAYVNRLKAITVN